MMIRKNALAVAVFLVAGLAACGGTNPVSATGNAQGITVDVQPRLAQTQPGGTVAFLSAVTGTVDTTVIWEVVDAGGGTIDTSGRYTAPTSVGQYRVRAVSKADPTVQGVATVAVVLTPSVGVSISPSSTSIAPGGSLTFAASVTGSADTAVSWTVRETSGCGAISSTGVYTAPGTAGTCHVVATSRADATKSATANVTVTSATPPPPSGPLPACATAPLRTTGTLYYYCDCGTGAAAGCVAGNDANPGTNPSAPRRTFSNARARFNGMNAGDTVALCRTGAWNENGGGVYNPRCTAGNTCDFRDYVPSWGDASSPTPRLNTSSGRVFSMETSGHDEGYRFWNLDVRQVAGQGQGFFMYSDVSDIDICNVRLEGGSIAIEMNSLNNPAHLARTTIRNSQFYNYSGQGVLGGTDDLVVDGNYFYNVGVTAGPSPQRHSIYLANSGYARMRVSNNEIYEDERCGGVMLVLHQIIADVTVENNKITSPSTDINCFGIQSNYSAVPLAQFDNLKVRRNRVFKTSGQGIVVKGSINGIVSDNITVNSTLDVGTPSCGTNVVCTSGTTVQNNTVHNSSLLVGGTNNVVENNAVTGSCNIGGTTVRNGNNVCNVNAASAWVNATGGNFTPVAGGPLSGAGSATSYSPLAAGSVAWSPTDAGIPRTPPIDAGAF